MTDIRANGMMSSGDICSTVDGLPAWIVTTEGNVFR